MHSTYSLSPWVIITKLSHELTWMVCLLKLKAPVENENLIRAVCTSVLWGSLLGAIQEWKLHLSLLGFVNSRLTHCEIPTGWWLFSQGKAQVWQILTFSCSLKGMQSHTGRAQRKKIENEGHKELEWNFKARSTSKAITPLQSLAPTNLSNQA